MDDAPEPDTHLLWNRSGRDWAAYATPGFVAERTGQPQAGDVLLLHDSVRYAAHDPRAITIGALPIILERLSSLGLRVRPAGELMSFERY
jgi:hypothetical protein